MTSASIHTDSELAPRDYALKLVREAKEVFIAYASSDLKMALRIRQKLLAIRSGTPGSSVFLDQDSLLPSGDVNPATIDARLNSADLVVVLCGRDTPTRTEVRRELDITLVRKAKGEVRVLPVILTAGVALPEGLDYRIQAIHLVKLFPEFRWLPLAVASLIVLLISVATFFGYRSWQDGIATRSLIDQDLARDSEAGVEAIDERRRERLLELAERARNIGYRTVIAELDRRISRLPDIRRRREIAKANPGRKFLSACGDSSVITASTTQIERFRLNNAQQWVFDQRRGQILSLHADRTRRRVLFLVEYENFADPEAAQMAKPLHGGGFDGPEGKIYGRQREVFALDCDAQHANAVSLGVFPEIATEDKVNLLGEGNGSKVYMPVYGQAWPAPAEVSIPANFGSYATTAVAAAQLKKRLGLPPRSRLVPLFAAPYDSHVFEVRSFVDQGSTDEQERQIEIGFFGGFWKYSPVCTGTRSFFRMEPEVFYSPRGGQLYSNYDDTDDDRPVPFEPKYTPTACHSTKGLAMLRDKLLVFDQGRLSETIQLDLKPINVESADFSDGGDRLLIKYRDGSIDAFETDGGRRVSRFPWTMRLAVLDVDSRGRYLLALEATGRLVAWELSAFGPDGWAEHTHPSRP